MLASGGSTEGKGEGAGERGLSPRLLDGFYRLREHILAEQDGAFPAALATLSSEQWRVVDKVREQVGRGGPATSGMSVSKVRQISIYDVR